MKRELKLLPGLFMFLRAKIIIRTLVCIRVHQNEKNDILIIDGGEMDTLRMQPWIFSPFKENVIYIVNSSL